MSLLAVALASLVDAALGLWLGSIVFFSFVGAPTTFRVLGRDRAGDVVNQIFPTYYLLGVGYGLLALFGLWVGSAVSSHAVAQSSLVALVCTALGVGVFAYSRWVLIPKMDAAGADAFAQYHRRSVLLNAATMLVVAVAFVAAHARPW